MNALELRKRLAEYADDELDPHHHREVERLIANDPAAKGEVERWKSLRRAAQRVLESEPVPGGLDERVRAILRREPATGRPRILRLGNAGLAVAAAIVMAITFWPTDAGATDVEADGFAQVYRACAVSHRHDAFRIRDANGDACPRALCRVQSEASFACLLPDVSRCGRYHVDGACQCTPQDGVRVVHAYFRNDDDPTHVLSVFAVDRQIDLCSAGKSCPCCKSGRHQFRDGRGANVSVVCWTRGDRSYVVCCGRLGSSELMELADGLDIALLEQLDRQLDIVLASVSRP